MVDAVSEEVQCDADQQITHNRHPAVTMRSVNAECRVLVCLCVLHPAEHRGLVG